MIKKIQSIMEREELGTFFMNIGATSVNNYSFLSVSQEDNNDFSFHSMDRDDEKLMNDLYDEIQSKSRNVDSIMLVKDVNAAHAKRSKGVNSEHIARVCRIYNEEEERTLEVTQQGSLRTPDSKLERNYGTNDRMIRSKHFNEYSFMDTLKATDKGGKSTWVNTYCLFICNRQWFLICFCN